MQYRAFGKTGEKVSALGFGMMRLPLKGGGFSSALIGGDRIDVDQSVALLRYAVDHGVNYVDTAYNYMDGNSERITGLALTDGYRDKVFLATKSPVWTFTSASDFDRVLAEQRRRLRTDRFDMYLLHGLSKHSWRGQVLPFGLIDKIRQAKESGLVRFIGFSFHDDLDTFREIADSADWDFCQIQLNYLDTGYQAGLAGLRYAAEAGMAVSIMEPLRGGYLADVPADAAERFRARGKGPVEMALDFLWDMPEVSLLLSGMSTLEQIRQNIEFASRAVPHMLAEEDQEAISYTVRRIREIFTIPCTGCNYCAHCPKGIVIPYNFHSYNLYSAGDLALAKKDYRENVPLFGAQASECIGCRKCEALCPQHIEISRWLPKIHALLGAD